MCAAILYPQAYLASDSEGRSGSEDGVGEGEGGEEEDEAAIRERYRSLLLGGGDAGAMQERQGKKDWGNSSGEGESSSDDEAEAAGKARVKDDKGEVTAQHSTICVQSSCGACWMLVCMLEGRPSPPIHTRARSYKSDSGQHTHWPAASIKAATPHSLEAAHNCQPAPSCRQAPLPPAHAIKSPSLLFCAQLPVVCACQLMMAAPPLARSRLVCCAI